MHEKLKMERIAVVSGATGYIGKEITKELAVAGFKVALLCYKTEPKIIEEILQTLPGAGHKAYDCDLIDSKSVSSVLETVEKELGPIYIAVHAAGLRPTRKNLYSST